MRDLTFFLKCCEKPELSDISQDDLRLYLSRLYDDGRSQATIARTLASLKAFFACMADLGFIEVSPALGISAPAAKRKPPQILSDSEIKRLLEQPDRSDPKGIRDKAMLETLYATGIRVSELIALDRSDVNLAAGIITCRCGRTIPVYSSAVSAISEYMLSTRARLAVSADENALFVNMDGSRMSRQGFWKILRQYKDKAQIQKDLNPQTLRNSFAAHMLERGTDPRLVQQILGHADISSTLVYARVDEDVSDG